MLTGELLSWKPEKLPELLQDNKAWTRGFQKRRNSALDDKRGKSRIGSRRPT